MKADIQTIRFKTILRYNSYFWSAWLLFYALVFSRNLNQPFLIGLFNSFYITSPLFALSLLLWPLVRRLQYTGISWRYHIIVHFIGANIFTILWLLIYYGALFALFGNDLYDLFDVSQTIGWQYPSGITFYLMVSGAYFVLIYNREIRSREIKETELQILLKETQITALKNQFNPHFLFNALNSINALITTEPQKARSMLIKLSDLLRLSLSVQKRVFVSLESELTFARAYLDIEKIRLAQRLNYKENISVSSATIEIPGMIIQPLLENAVKHGVAVSSMNGFIELNITANNTKLNINIRNSFPGIITTQKTDNNLNGGLGLRNLQKRLENIFGQEMRLSYDEKEEQYFEVTIEMPLHRIKKNENQ